MHARVVLAGAWDTKLYEEQVRQMPEFKNVDYIGFLGAAEVAANLDGCLAGFSTLLNEGQYNLLDTLPTKVYEYMAMGLPVILSNTPYHKRLNEKYKFGMCVDPSSPQEIADAVNYLKSNSTLAEEMGRRGRNAVLRYFNWKTEEKKLLALYSSIA
jgi:glycosyltransferase involved in cell wall biosynthesis